MKRLKDFIYNINDILIALLILVVALAIIIWRMNVIMNYPKELLGTTDVPEGTTLDLSSEDQTQGSDTKMPGDIASVDNNEIQDDENIDVVEVSIVYSEDGKLQETTVVDIEGNSASAAVQCMIDKGLFEDYNEYKKICDDNGLDPEKIAAGRFKFMEGSTKLSIAKQVNWG